VVKAIAPYLEKINPDQLVALIPAISKISVSTWEKLIELLNKLTTAQVRCTWQSARTMLQWVAADMQR
jgi:hypothetical protein